MLNHRDIKIHFLGQAPSGSWMARLGFFEDSCFGWPDDHAMPCPTCCLSRSGRVRWAKPVYWQMRPANPSGKAERSEFLSLVPTTLNLLYICFQVLNDLPTLYTDDCVWLGHFRGTLWFERFTLYAGLEVWPHWVCPPLYNWTQGRDELCINRTKTDQSCIFLLSQIRPDCIAVPHIKLDAKGFLSEESDDFVLRTGWTDADNATTMHRGSPCSNGHPQ